MSQTEYEAFRRLLSELADMAEGASLTGALKGGEARAIEKYNAILRRATDMGGIPEGIYSALPPHASYAEIAVEARMLAAQLAPSRKDQRDPGILMRLAPFLQGEELSRLVREQIEQQGSLDLDMIANLAPFLDGPLLSELVRFQRSSGPAPEPPRAPQPPRAPEPPIVPTPPQEPSAHPVAAAEANQTAEDVVALLKNPHLTDQEREALMHRLDELVRRR